MSYSTEIKKVDDLLKCLSNTNKTTIVKFGATWCGPCKKVEPLFFSSVQKYRDKFNWVVIDIDESMELYSFFKSKRIVQGVPAFLRYDRRTRLELTLIPDDILIGADSTQLQLFINRALNA
jgi:thiol-disulfide isomerase/thioredoxin